MEYLIYPMINQEQKNYYLYISNFFPRV